jgi:hypothetical protein
MEQVQTQAPQIRTLLDSSNQFYKDLLGYKLEQTSLQQIPQNQWNEFSTQRGLNPNSSGIYLPRNQTAIIQEENPLSLFHEYFGHGLYCEQNLIGRKLVDLEKKLLEEEKQEFFNSRFTLEDIQKFRQKKPTFQELENFRQENLGKYELFAIWTEYLLSSEHALKDLFERKYDSLSGQEKEAVDSVIGFSEQYGNLATIYAQGMARRTTAKRVRRLLGGTYGNEAVNNSKLVLLTGSKKPFSDIDLFASSDYLRSAKNDWLDLVVFDEEDFERRIGLFEVQLTLPIMEGEFVAGDENYLQQKIRQLQEQPITEEAIKHNFEKSDKERIASEETNDEEQKRVFSSYSKSYLANALALRRGLRLFSKEDLISYSLRASVEDDKPPQLQGGRKNAT